MKIRSPLKPSLKNKRAQVLVEYLLLMVIAVGLATLLTKTLINRSGGSGINKTGIIITAWDKLLKNVGQDLPDCEKPNCQQ
jgi:hypothetical protein